MPRRLQHYSTLLQHAALERDRGSSSSSLAAPIHLRGNKKQQTARARLQRGSNAISDNKRTARKLHAWCGIPAAAAAAATAPTQAAAMAFAVAAAAAAWHRGCLEAAVCVGAGNAVLFNWVCRASLGSSGT